MILKEFYKILKLQKKQPPEVFWKKGVLKIFAKLTGNICSEVSFLIKLLVSLQLYLKKTSVQVFFYKFCKIFKKTYLKNTYERLI